MKMTPVTSSNIAAIGHCEDTAQLAIKFKNGKTFVYSDVSYDDHFYLISSESIGKHFNQFIKAVKVGREVVTAENDNTPMSDKEKIKILRDALEEIGGWDKIDASNRIIDIAEKALEATKDGE